MKYNTENPEWRDISQKDMYLDDFVNKVCAYVKKRYK